MKIRSHSIQNSMNHGTPLHVRQGISTRADFTLIRSKTAVLVIDIQDHLSSRDAVTNREDENQNQNHYLFEKALPSAIPKIAKLLNCARSIRDGLNKVKDDYDNEDNKHGLLHVPGCEVVITFLQAQTPDCRDVSLDYKLSGPKLSKLPNSTNVAKFDTLPNELCPSTSGKGDIILPKTSCSVFQSTNLRYILSNLGVCQLVVCGQLTDQCVMSAVRDAADLGYFVTVVEDCCAALSREDHDRGILGMKGFARILTTSEVLEELNDEDGQSKEGAGGCSGGGCGEEEEFGIAAHVDLITEDVENKYEESAIRFKEPSMWKAQNEYQHYAVIDTLLHTLKLANVRFLRFAIVDVSNNIRVKVVPIKRLISSSSSDGSKTSSGTALNNCVSIAEACAAGMPSFADMIVSGTNIDSKDVLMIQPDLSSLRILPYSIDSAMVFGTLHDQRTSELSDLCPRGLLSRVIEFASENFGIGFTVGVEIEFCLVRARVQGLTNVIEPIDASLFAGTTTLDDQDVFISDIYSLLEKQRIDVETIHAESAPGQMEIVLPYQNDVMKLADYTVFTRETIKACAKKYGMQAIFLPKVYDNQAGNGMHIHMSLRNKWSGDPSVNIFPGTAPYSIGNIGQSFIEGILTNLEGLLSMTMPTPNSFARVGEGCWTGHKVGWDVEDKESPLRVCLDAKTCKATNVELKLVDNSCNVYLALASVLWAGVDGIARRLNLRPKMREHSAFHKSLPSDLETSLRIFSNSKLFQNLLGEKLLKSYVAVKRAEIKHHEMTRHEVEDLAMMELKR